MFKLNIKRQMTLALLLPTLFIGGSLLYFVMINNQQVMTVYNQEKMLNKLETYAVKVSHMFDSVETDGKLITDYAKKDLTQLQAYVHGISHKHPELNYYVYFLPQGDLYDNSFGYGHAADSALPTLLSIPPKSFFTQDLLVPEKQWFFNVFKKDAARWYGPYEKNNSKGSISVLTFALPIYNQDAIIGVVAIDYPLVALQKKLAEMSYYPSGYVALLDQNMKFIAHPTLKPGLTLPEQVGEAYRFMDTRFRTSESGQLTYTWVDQQKKVLVFKHIHNDWVMALTTYEKEAFAQNKAMNQKLVSLFLGSLFFVSLVSLVIGNSISNPLTQLTKSLIAPVEERNATIQSLAKKPNEIGTLANRLMHYFQLNEAEAAELTHYNDNLDKMTVKRIAAYFQANVELLKQEETIQKRQALLKLENEHLEHSIQEMVAAERQLVDQEKMASFRHIIASVSAEIKSPLDRAQLTLVNMQNTLARLKSISQHVPVETEALQTLGHLIQKNNRRLFSNLMFAKDIVDYIKDLAADENHRQKDTVELLDYLKKAVASLDYLEREEPLELILPKMSALFLQLDASKFLHVLSSLLIHIVSKANAESYGLVLTLQVLTHQNDLEIRVLVNSTLDTLKDPTKPSDFGMNFAMLELLLREGFKGHLTLDAREVSVYSLYFPNVIVGEDA